MKWNRNIVTASAILSIAFTGGFIGYTQSKPDYVQDAITRLSSYLSNYYGPTKCSGNDIHNNKWQVRCTVENKGKSFEFTVMPAEMAPYSVARSFYLKANEANAEQAAQLGLMRYLQIDINHIKTKQ